MTAAFSGVLSAVLLVSLVTETVMQYQAAPGVIIAQEVTTRKGDGERYAPAFREPLHAGTEFRQLEVRGSWRHIRLPDGQTCWIPARAAETVHPKGRPQNDASGLNGAGRHSDWMRSHLVKIL